MLRPGLTALIFVSLGLLTGCSTDGLNSSLFVQNTIGGDQAKSAKNNTHVPTVTGSIVPGLPKGYQCPFVPNGFDPVASIYRLDKSGTYFRVADLSNDKRVLANIKNNVKIGNYVFSDTQKASADLSVSLLKRVLPGLSGSARSNQEFDVGITVKNMHAKVLYDREADYIRDWFSKKIRPKAGNRYFLVREAIFAGSVSYTMNAKDLKAAGMQAKVEQVVDATANATFVNHGQNLVIEQTFNPPNQVCIKVAEIEIGPRPTGSRGAVAALKPTSRSTLPQIKRVAQ